MRHIVGRAAQYDSRVVTLSGLVFFSTETGDAWMLDPADGLALCLARDGSELTVNIVETPEQFAVEWTCRFHIDGELFVFMHPDGRVTRVFGYPTREIRRAIRQLE